MTMQPAAKRRIKVGEQYIDELDDLEYTHILENCRTLVAGDPGMSDLLYFVSAMGRDADMFRVTQDSRRKNTKVWLL